jgi:hypothetical protein
LTQRVDRAERDRDLAVTRCRELQARYDQLEEELAKKRAELRELLRQESGGGSSSRYRERELVVKRELERLTNTTELEVGSGGAEGGGQSLPEDREMDRLSERSGGSVSRLETFSLASGLPKIELKSPARVLEETGGARSASRSEMEKLKNTPSQVPVPVSLSILLTVPVPFYWQSEQKQVLTREGLFECSDYLVYLIL